jgi:hypothetical protein
MFQIQSRAGVDRLVMEASTMYLTGMEGFDLLSRDKHIHINTGRSLLIQSKVGNPDCLISKSDPLTFYHPLESNTRIKSFNPSPVLIQ